MTILGNTWRGGVVATDDKIRETTIKYEEKGQTLKRLGLSSRRVYQELSSDWSLSEVVGEPLSATLGVIV